MPYRFRVSVLTALFAAFALLGAPVQPAAAAGEKVAVIVGPVGSLSDTYRALADQVAAAASAAGATVAKAYSPSATWANVKSAVNGANVIVYLGHGNGYPNPYTIGHEYTDRTNGWGLNRTTTNGDADSWSSTMVYCGEKALLGTLTSTDGAAQQQYCGGTSSGGITPAPNFTMIYAQAHYAPGFGERYTQSTPLTTLDEAQQRVRNYSTPILALGGTFIATAYGDADEIVTRVLTQPTRAFADIVADGGGWSPSTAVSMAHPDSSGSQVWVQRTTISGFHFSEPDYWYAFAGRPSKTPAGGTAAVSVATPPTAPTPSVDVSRLAGADRYATAAAISAASFSPAVPVAYVATGANFPDALAAGAAAARQGGPVLLVTGGSVPAATAGELSRLRPAAIKVVGGSSIVSDGVLAALQPYATTGSVTRLAGVDRYATAAAISGDAFATGVGVAYIATGQNFPDALAGVAAAGSGGGPVLLTNPDQLPAATATELARLRPNRIVILGGTGVISEGVASALRPYATGGTVDRLSGADRYATAVNVSASTFASSEVAFIATGTNFPDALGGGPVAGSVPGPLLLVPGTSVPASVVSELQRLGPARVVILGGTSVVSSSVQAQIASILGQ